MLTTGISQVVQQVAGTNAVFEIINQARPPADYMFAQYLPERNEPDFYITAGSMRVIPTMAGLATPDSPYPQGGTLDAKIFTEETAKLAIETTLDEKQLIKMHQMLIRLKASGAPTTQFIVNNVLNFADKVLAQALRDRKEWLRGQALVAGKIDWTFNKKNLVVDYGLVSGSFQANRTGNDGYGGSTSKFWADLVAAKKFLKHDVQAFIAHPDTIEMILANSANNLLVLAQADGSFDITRHVGSIERQDTDTRYRVKLIAYGAEGEVFDPANPGKTLKVKFMPTGKILAIGNPPSPGFQVGWNAVGQGATPQIVYPLGYTHVAPTVEGGLRDGDWGRVYTPDENPASVVGQAVSNSLPVIEPDNRLYIMSTDIT